MGIFKNCLECPISPGLCVVKELRGSKKDDREPPFCQHNEFYTSVSEGVRRRGKGMSKIIRLEGEVEVPDNVGIMDVVRCFDKVEGLFSGTVTGTCEKVGKPATFAIRRV
jgi:hypothetical protein